MAEPGLVLDNRYRLDDRIAAGGMGEVWRATDLALGRPVAVKLMRPGYAQDAEGLARFRAEARYAGSLAHPNIAVVYDFWEGDPPGQPYLVMELVNGPSLARVLTRGPMGPVPTLDVIAQTAAGLQVAHEVGLVHRDIKPANLLVSPGGQIKISDFGIARADSSATLTGTGLVVGTAAYMAPERVSGQSATPGSDLYALGIVAHECLTGQRPFDGDALTVAVAHLQRELPPLPPSVPAEVAGLVAALAAKDPRARPPTAGMVAQRAAHLRAVLTGEVAGGTAGGAEAAVMAESPPLASAARPVSPMPGGTTRMAGFSAGGGTRGFPTGQGGDFAEAQTGHLTGPDEAGFAGGYGEQAEGPRRRRGPILAAVAVAGAGAVAAWLVFASGPSAQRPSARPAQARHSARATRPAATRAPGLVSDSQPPQPGAGATVSQAPPPAPSPSPSPSSSSRAPIPGASSRPPAPTPAPTGASPPPPTATASPGAASG